MQSLSKSIESVCVLSKSLNTIVRAGDFGCSQKLHWDDTGESISPTNRSDITGTVAYRAPELLRGSPPAVPADIYAFGILLWQMMSQKHPYVGKVSAKLTKFLGLLIYCCAAS